MWYSNLPLRRNQFPRPVIIGIAETHVLYRQALALSLSSLESVKVIAESATICALLDKPESESVNVIISGLEINDPNCYQMVRTLSLCKRKVKLILYGCFEDEKLIRHLFKHGVYGFVNKCSSLDVLLDAILFFNSKSHFYIPTYQTSSDCSLSSNIGNGYRKLSNRELDVLIGICKGFSNKDIADFLKLSVRTVEKLREKIKNKTGIKNSAELIKYAIKNHLYCPYTDMPVKYQ